MSSHIHDNKSSQQKFITRLVAIWQSGGPVYSSLYIVRWILQRFMEQLDHRLVAIEQRKGIMELWTILSQRFTVSENKQLWNTYDWSALGEEWTPNDSWKDHVVQEIMMSYIPQGGLIVEIGPGGGRWTEFLQKRATKLLVVDIAEKAIELCRARFADCTNIHYLVGDGHSIPLSDISVDAIWSYDVFVHLNPLDARAYFREFARLLAPGGYAVIHHPGPFVVGQHRRPGWRSDLTDKMISEFVKENGLLIIEQTQKYVNKGDILSIITKPAQA